MYGDVRFVPDSALSPILLQNYFRDSRRNIDSRTSQSAQYRIRDAGFSDSIIARWQHSKEFCNKIRQQETWQRDGLKVTLRIYRENQDGSGERILQEEIGEAEGRTFTIP